MGIARKAHITKQIEALSAQLNELLAEAVKPDARIPLEPVPNNRSIPRYVTFVKYFTGTQAYRYVAVRPEGRSTWAVSGKGSMTRVTWDKLMQFVLENETDEARAAASIRQLTGGYDPQDTGLVYADTKDQDDEDEAYTMNEMPFFKNYGI